MALLAVSAFIVALVASAQGHSMLICAKYDTATGNCAAPIRGVGYAEMQEAYDLTTGGSGICQFPWVNPISSYYANGSSCYDWAPCPEPMGTFTPGESFTILWYARNHATEDQTPGNISLYLSPIETENQGSDATAAQFEQQLICTAPYMSCGGQNGNTVPCTTTCTFPAAATGLYTMWWLWDWIGHDKYSTCADVLVTSSNSAASTTTTGAKSSTSTTTGAKASTTTTGVKASTTTTGQKSSTSTSTTGAKAAPSTTGRAKSTSSTGKPSASTSTSTTAAPAPAPVSPPVISTPTPVPTPAPTPVPTPAPVSSSSCTVGQRSCLTDSTYSVCSNGRDGGVWSAPMSCTAGLSCHQTDPNTIYCY